MAQGFTAKAQTIMDLIKPFWHINSQNRENCWTIDKWYHQQDVPDGRENKELTLSDGSAMQKCRAVLIVM